MIILEAKSVNKRFGGVQALAEGNLTCRKGRITGLLGANGSGKSTFSKIIAGVFRADDGEIIFKGNTIKYKHPDQARRDGIGLVFQNLSLAPDLTVWQNIVLGMEEKKGIFTDSKSARKLSEEILNRLLPNLDIEREVRDLRPGEMQIVEVAKAISNDPELLILDEPTAALDSEQVERLFACMRELAQKGVSMIFTSHRMPEVMEICDDITILKNGTNVAHMDFDVDEKDEQKIINYICDSTNQSDFQQKVSYKCMDEQFIVEDLQLGDFIIGLNLSVKKGEVLGVGGLAGQGQRELLLALAGFYPDTKAEFKINGKRVKLKSPINAIENGILLVPGDRQVEGLFLDKSVYENLIFPRVCSKKDPFFISRKINLKYCQKIIDKLNIIVGDVDMAASNLSGGNQQKVVVGKWITFEKTVILLEDPAKGVDIGAKKDLYNSIIEQVKENQLSVILYASDNEELIEYCDRVLIMYEGKIVKELVGDEINDDTIIQASVCVK